MSINKDLASVLKKKLLLLIALWVSLSITLHANAKTPLRIVTTEEAPYQYTEQNKIEGVSAKILYELLKATGYEDVKINMYPWSRAYRMALNNKKTLIFTIARNEEREKLFHWTCLLFEEEYVVYKLKTRKDITITRLDDIKKYRMGLWHDDARHHFFSSRGFTNIETVIRDELNIRKMLAGRIDLYVGASISFPYQMKRIWGFQEEFDLFEPVYTLKEAHVPLYIAFSLKTDEALRARFADALEKLKERGYVQSILNTYIR